MNVNVSDTRSTVASTASIRSQFPALDRLHNGNRVAYFDGPGGTQVPRAVAEAMLDYLFNHNANTDWAYPTSAETDAVIAGARTSVGDFLNASPHEIVFGANMTTLTFHLSRAIGRRLSADDEIIVTELDHHANVDPWKQVAADRGLNVRIVRMIPETGGLDWAHFEGLLNPCTRLVAMGAASNALGTISDVARAGRMAHAVGALMFVDAVHLAPHVLPDVHALDCDFLACSAYKFNGPHVGVLYGKGEMLESLDFPKLEPAHDNTPDRVETGTLNHEGIAGTAAAIDFFASLSDEGTTRRERLESSFAEIHQRESALVSLLWTGLSAIDGVRLYGPPPSSPRTPTIAFTVRGMTSRRVAELLAELGVFVSNGDFYASTVLKRLGLAEEGLVRAGCAVYTTRDEVDRLVAGVAALIGRRTQ